VFWLGKMRRPCLAGQIPAVFQDVSSRHQEVTRHGSPGATLAVPCRVASALEADPALGLVRAETWFPQSFDLFIIVDVKFNR